MTTHRLKHIILTLLLALLAAALLVVPTPATFGYNRSGEVPNVQDTSRYIGSKGWRPSVFWVGDSISVSAYKYGLHTLRPGYEVSAISGRDVSNLPYYLADRLGNGSRLTTVVIALGTNASKGWTYASLRAAVRRIPRRITVVFVSTYRDPRIFTRAAYPYRQQAWVQAQYTSWMRTIARQRPHTCIAQWRNYASHHRSKLHDGVHPDRIGIRAYIRTVTRAVARCS